MAEAMDPMIHEDTPRATTGLAEQRQMMSACLRACQVSPRAADRRVSRERAACERNGRVGTIAPGKVADLVVLAGDPARYHADRCALTVDDKVRIRTDLRRRALHAAATSQLRIPFLTPSQTRSLKELARLATRHVSSGSIATCFARREWFRIPASQPISPQHPEFFFAASCGVRCPLSGRSPRRPAAVCRRNLHDFNGWARTKRVRIPDRCCASPKQWASILRHNGCFILATIRRRIRSTAS
jgi:hypothetical protein